MIEMQFVEEAIGKTIRDVHMVFAKPSCTRGSIGIKFDDNSGIMIEDAEQQCCEKRYMTIEDDLSYFSGARLLGIEVKDVLIQNPKSYMQHDVQFLEILTTKGVLSVASHNEHNGYYSGFKIIVKRWMEAKNG